MAMVAKVHVSTLECHHYYHRGSGHPPLSGNVLPRVVTTWDPLIVKGRRRIVLQPCRSFKSEDEYVKGSETKKPVNKLVGAIRSAVWSCSKPSLRTENKFREAIEKLEERLFLVCPFDLCICTFWHVFLSVIIFVHPI